MQEIERLIANLCDGDIQVRVRAVNALAKSHDARVVERLVAALNDPDEGGRYGAAEALGRIGDRRAVEPLIAARLIHCVRSCSAILRGRCARVPQRY